MWLLNIAIEISKFISILGFLYILADTHDKVLKDKCSDRYFCSVLIWCGCVLVTYHFSR